MPNPPFFGQRQPMAQVAGRPPVRPMPGGQMQRPGQPQQQRPPMDPMQARKMITARKMMLQSELLKIKAMESMMPDMPKGNKNSGG